MGTAAWGFDQKVARNRARQFGAWGRAGGGLNIAGEVPAFLSAQETARRPGAGRRSMGSLGEGISMTPLPNWGRRWFSRQLANGGTLLFFLQHPSRRREVAALPSSRSSGVLRKSRRGYPILVHGMMGAVIFYRNGGRSSAPQLHRRRGPGGKNRHLLRRWETALGAGPLPYTDSELGRIGGGWVFLEGGDSGDGSNPARKSRKILIAPCHDHNFFAGESRRWSADRGKRGKGKPRKNKKQASEILSGAVLFFVFRRVFAFISRL